MDALNVLQVKFDLVTFAPNEGLNDTEETPDLTLPHLSFATMVNVVRLAAANEKLASFDQMVSPGERTMP